MRKLMFLCAFLMSCGSDPTTLVDPNATPAQPGVCIDTGNPEVGSLGLIFRPCDEIDDTGVCQYRFLDGVGSSTDTTTCRACLARVTDSREDLEAICARYDLAD